MLSLERHQATMDSQSVSAKRPGSVVEFDHRRCRSASAKVGLRSVVEFDHRRCHGEWGKWAAIAAVIPNRSQAECRVKWTSTTPEWTPQEEVLLTVALEACGKGP
jgi:hypothetical protein